MQEASALQRNVAGANQESFSGRLGEAENIIRRDAEFTSTRNIRVLGSASGGQDEGFSGHFLLDLLLVHGLHGMGVQEAGILVEVSDLDDGIPLNVGFED